MTGRTALLRSSAEKKSPDGDPLLELYWNRAELKKEFARLKDEQFRLKSRIKEQEGSTARVQQKLEHLENLLLDPDWVHTVAVFYQLRALSLRFERKLAKFAEQLKQQREQRQHGRVLAAWKEKRDEDAAALERRIGEHRAELQVLEDRREADRHRLASMGGVLKYFKRRSVVTGLDALAEKIAEHSQEEERLLLDYDRIRKLEPPEQQGLDVAAKRSVNFMILAFAQQLYAHFGDDSLAAMAKEANDKSVGAVNYGSRSDCDTLIRRIRDRSASFDDMGEFAETLQRRARLLAEQAMFRSDEDAVPVADSVATLLTFGANGLVNRRDVNLLGENYWQLVKVLSR